ncbi:CGNR zinc finger domain-containing protein [Labedella populi]|uniref:CGNR zinc finger domain-containing protein n=1 Tax=Labedella populi TaxID=2498850 RepID=UPI001AA09736|nr:ABATE domain-containing protein [Labedella populi]
MKHVFVSGNLGLDLLGTLKWRRSEEEELLEDPSDLDAWITEAGVLTVSPASTAFDLKQAMTLREAIYALVHSRLEGSAWSPSALDTLNRWNGHDGPTTRLTPDGVERIGGTASALAVVARAATDVLSHTEPGVLKECANERCTRLFIDESRGSRRSWCGMAECGNRAKAAAYRARKKAGTAASS